MQRTHGVGTVERMTTRTPRPSSATVPTRLVSALRRLPAAANEYTLHHFNPQHELRGRR